MNKAYWGILVAVIVILIIGVNCSAQAAETDRQYIERVHTYAHGNSIYIKSLARQDVKHQETLDIHSETLASHGARIHAQAGYSAGNRALINSLYANANSQESRLASLERNMEQANEANAIALAVAGHQFDTKGGFQTAISASTVNGKQALALGAGGAINDRLFINAGVSQSGSTTGGVVSSTISW